MTRQRRERRGDYRRLVQAFATRRSKGPRRYLCPTIIGLSREIAAEAGVALVHNPACLLDLCPDPPVVLASLTVATLWASKVASVGADLEEIRGCLQMFARANTLSAAAMPLAQAVRRFCGLDIARAAERETDPSDVLAAPAARLARLRARRPALAKVIRGLLEATNGDVPLAPSADTLQRLVRTMLSSWEAEVPEWLALLQDVAEALTALGADYQPLVLGPAWYGVALLLLVWRTEGPDPLQLTDAMLDRGLILTCSSEVHGRAALSEADRHLVEACGFHRFVVQFLGDADMLDRPITRQAALPMTGRTPFNEALACDPDYRVYRPGSGQTRKDGSRRDLRGHR